MKFKTELVPWINEIKSYLTDSSKKIGELKKVLKSVDFSNLDYPTKIRLSALFDPRCEITKEIFKRELTLYFSLLESKNNPIKIPIFSDYIDWIYSQDISRLNDVTFDLISSSLLKTTATNLSEPINSFMARLPEEFNKSIDTLSNSRISTLINILNETKNGYDNMPLECQNFVKRMFLACAVKTEIAEKNKLRFRGAFRDDPRYYYGIFNKAFAGVGEYESWIDEPAKKLTYKNMVNYANFQENVLANTKYGLDYQTFSSCASDLNLPRMPEYDPSQYYFKQYYLAEPREYKDYAKKMGDLFVEMVRGETEKIYNALINKSLKPSDIEAFAVTHRIKRKFGKIDFKADAKTVAKAFADELISMVHLDELTGQSYRDIFSEPKTVAEKSDKPVQVEQNNNLAETQVKQPAKPAKPKTEKVSKVAPKSNDEDFDQESEYDLDDQVDYYKLDLDSRIQNRCCVPDDLPELYERYNELLERGEHNIDLENAMFDLEVRITEERQDEEYDYSGEKDKD